MSDNKIVIDIKTVRKMIADQFPEWKDLAISPVTCSGWDNKTFHLGDSMLIRMPSDLSYVSQVEKEQLWLPKLAPLLPLPISIPLAMGMPTNDYPWKWSIYRWLEGDTASTGNITDLCDFATSLGRFLIALQNIDTKGGPVAGLHSFYRGGSLSNYDLQARNSIVALQGKIDAEAALKIWEKAVATTWKNPPSLGSRRYQCW